VCCVRSSGTYVVALAGQMVVDREGNLLWLCCELAEQVDAGQDDDHKSNGDMHSVRHFDWDSWQSSESKNG